MKTRLPMRLIWLSTAVLICSIVHLGAHPAQAQRGKRTFRRAQFEQSIPSVDLPSPAMEGDIVPSMQDVIPPSLEGSGSRIAPEMPMDDPKLNAPMAEDYGQTDYGHQVYDQVDPQPMDQHYQGDDYGAFHDQGPAPVYSTGTWYRRGRWYSGFEVLFMTRTPPRNRNLVALINSAQILTSENAVGHNFRPGTRLTLGRFFGRDTAGRDHMLEFEFKGLFEWEDTRVFDSGPGTSFVGLALGTDNIFLTTRDEFSQVINVDALRIEYDADYNNFALNYKIASRPGRDQLAMQPDGRWVRHAAASQMRTLMAGLRYARFNETFTAFGRTAAANIETTEQEDGGFISDNIATTTEAERGSYRVLTNNDMFGFHVGGESVEKFDEWSWGVRGSVGAMANFAQRRNQAQSRNLNTDGNVITNSEVVRATDADGNELFVDSNGTRTTDAMDDGTANTPAFDVTNTIQLDFTDVAFSETSSDENFVFVADAGIFATYQLRPNLHFKAGYNFTYLSGLALAVENLRFNNGFEEFNLNGSTLIHGGSVGFETTW